jgi:hypothetical protein
MDICVGQNAKGTDRFFSSMTPDADGSFFLDRTAEVVFLQ